MTLKTNLVWITPDADVLITYMARVSNPDAKLDDPSDKLIIYLLKHKHFSPFEMACMCVEIHTTRDIARQILRHRSFHFQEFSQRYSVVPEEPEFSDARLQDHKNRQNSLPVEDKIISKEWARFQSSVWTFCWAMYQAALKVGIAKELARKLLPEGLTQTRMYMQGTIRDWLHYVAIRASTETQKEHRDVANAIVKIMDEKVPVIMTAARNAGVIG